MFGCLLWSLRIIACCPPRGARFTSFNGCCQSDSLCPCHVMPLLIVATMVVCVRVVFSVRFCFCLPFHVPCAMPALVHTCILRIIIGCALLLVVIVIRVRISRSHAGSILNS